MVAVGGLGRQRSLGLGKHMLEIVTFALPTGLVVWIPFRPGRREARGTGLSLFNKILHVTLNI